MDVFGRPVVVIPRARRWGRAAGKQRARRIAREPMRVPGGSDVRQTSAIAGDTAGTWSSVCKHRAPRPVRERGDRSVSLVHRDTASVTSPSQSPPPTQLEHTQGIHLTPSSPPSVNPFTASHIYTVISAFL